MSMFSSSDNQNTLERWDSKARQNIRKKPQDWRAFHCHRSCAISEYDRIDRGYRNHRNNYTKVVQRELNLWVVHGQSVY